jgi:hypothetical protein
MKRILFAFFSAFFTGVMAQSPIAVQPIEGPVDFAGTFGELRSHHFHSGVDIRTGGQTGWPVRAVQDGYLTRMVVRPDGFGWALYLRHSNGYTSVYAHLDDFKPEWHELAIARATTNQSHRLDLYFGPGEFPVNAGDTIGWSGNSGGSAGPHLHFEWRDSRTEEPLNPFTYGLIYGEDSYSPRFIAIHTSDGQYATVTNGSWSRAIEVSSWQDLSVEIRDKKHENGLNLGIQALKATWEWDQESFSMDFKMDRFPFDQTRCADGLMQPEVHRIRGKRTYRLGPSLGLYPKWSESDTSIWHPRSYNLEITAVAANGEVVSIHGPVILSKTVDNRWHPEVAKQTRYGSTGERIAGEMRVVWPEDCFTEPIRPNFVKKTNSEWQASPDVPVLKSLQYVWTPPVDYPEAWRAKTVLVGRDARGSYRIVGEPQQNGEIQFNMKIFGTVTLTRDLEAPVFSALRSASFQGKDAKCLTLSDNMLDIIDYRAFVDGDWTWSFYDAKNKRLYIPDFPSSAKALRVTATDEAGNVGLFITEFP